MKSPEQRGEEHFRRNVAVDGEHLGIEVDELSLDQNRPNSLKSTFGEIYFRTVSGNIYLIKKMAANEKEALQGEYSWSIIGGKENEGWKIGTKLKGATLSKEDVKSKALKIGEPYGGGVGTGEVAEIVAVDEKTKRANLNELTEGRTNTITKDFGSLLQPEKNYK